MERTRLSVDESLLMRQAANFDEIIMQSQAVRDLVEKGLLLPRYEDAPERGYIISLDGADVVQGYGRYSLQFRPR